MTTETKLEPLIDVIADEMAGDSDEAQRIRRLVWQ